VKRNVRDTEMATYVLLVVLPTEDPNEAWNRPLFICAPLSPLHSFFSKIHHPLPRELKANKLFF
jgi:hypothetical protein